MNALAGSGSATDWSERIGYLPHVAAVVVLVGLVLAILGLVPRRRTFLLCAVVAVGIGWALFGLTRDVTIATSYDPHTGCGNAFDSQGSSIDLSDPCGRAALGHVVVAMGPLVIALGLLLHALLARTLAKLPRSSKDSLPS